MIDEEQKQGISTVTTYVRFTIIFFCVITVILASSIQSLLSNPSAVKGAPVTRRFSLSYEHTNGMFLNKNIFAVLALD